MFASCYGGGGGGGGGCDGEEMGWDGMGREGLDEVVEVVDEWWWWVWVYGCMGMSMDGGLGYG